MEIEKCQGRWTVPISIVIPAYNEAGRILPALEALGAFLGERFRAYEIVCVDDGSRDETWRLLCEYSRPGVKALRLPQNRGKGYAIKYGMERAGGALLFFTDADLPYHPRALETAMEAFRLKGCDLVTDARELAHNPQALRPDRARGLASRVFSGLTARLFDLQVRDTQCGFKGFTQAAARQIFPRLQICGYVFDVEVFLLARRLGMKVCRIPVALVQQGGSRVRLLRDPFMMLVDLIRLAIRERRARVESRQRIG